MVNKRHVINVQGAIFREDGRFLIIKRSEREDFMPGILALPGGTIEPEDEAADDVLKTAIKREIYEETHVEADVVDLVLTRFFMADDDPVINVVFLCKYITGEPRARDPEEVEDVFWMTVEDAINDPHCRSWTREYLTSAQTTMINHPQQK